MGATRNSGKAADVGGVDLSQDTERGYGAASHGASSAPSSGGTHWFVKWALILVGVLLACFVLYRWGGTSHYRGTVQRVYEKGAEYRVEFTQLSGKVRVIGNAEMRFPYFKTNTADLHAELNRLARTGDVVDIRVWGFRQSWLSMFPNVVDVNFVYSAEKRAHQHAEAVADAVIATLANRDALKNNDQATRAAIVEAVIRASSNTSSLPQKGSPDTN